MIINDLYWELPAEKFYPGYGLVDLDIDFINPRIFQSLVSLFPIDRKLKLSRTAICAMKIWNFSLNLINLQRIFIVILGYMTLL